MTSPPVCPADPHFGPATRARAEAAIAAVDTALSHLKQDAATRRSRSSEMRRSWKGDYADQFFGREVPRMTKQTQQLIQELLNLKQQISNAIDEGTTLQRRFDTWNGKQSGNT